VISPNNERIQIVTDKAEKGFYELVIANVLPEDAGKYSCTARNKYGEVSCEATVTVTSKLMLVLVIITGEADDISVSQSLSLSLNILLVFSQ
jgi:Immunoglobulin I-set domain.